MTALACLIAGGLFIGFFWHIDRTEMEEDLRAKDAELHNLRREVAGLEWSARLAHRAAHERRWQ